MTDREHPVTRASARSDVTHDAVIIVPGIMGSELYDARTERTIWGMNKIGWYVRAWTTGSGLADLRLTDAERDGRYDRVAATRLLRFPAFFRVLAGLEPYTKLVKAVRAKVAHDDAVLEFAYDWRLPVAYNAHVLAEAARRHLDAWRAHPAHDQARRHHPDQRPAQLVFVAHSMGGLLVRGLHREFDSVDDIRATVTLGTPFYGAVKAAALLNTGRGAPIPLPARRPFTSVLRPDADQGLRDLVRGLPGVHDLLPVYRCLVDDADKRGSGVDDGDVRRLGVDDVAALGGDKELAAESLALHRGLAGIALRGHRAFVGIEQPTAQSLRLTDGIVHVEERTYAGQSAGKDRRGDGTVYTESAAVSGAAVSTVAQQHGALASTDAALRSVAFILTEHDLDLFGPPLGKAEIGLALPDVVTPGEVFVAQVNGLDRPRGAELQVYDVGTGRSLNVEQPLHERDGAVEADIRLPRPGLFRVQAVGGAGAPVEQLVLAIDPAQAD